LRSLAKSTSQDSQATAAAGLVWPWLATAVVLLVGPWTLYLAGPRRTLSGPLSPAVLWKALWPVLLGGVLAIALWRWWRSLPRIPKGDIIVALDGGMQMAVAWGKGLERMDGVLRQGPGAGLSLVFVCIALGAA